MPGIVRRQKTTKNFKKTPLPVGKVEQIKTLDMEKKEVIPDNVSVSLPANRHKPPENINAFSFLIYGVRGIGKSTLANMFGKAFFMMFERDKTLQAYQKPIRYWTEVIEYIRLLLSSEHDFDVVVWDNLAHAYEMALSYAGQKGGFDHPGGRDDFGAAWNKVRTMFVTPVSRLLNSDLGMIGISHEKVETIRGLTGHNEHMRIRPDCSGQAYSYFGAEVENIFYYHYWKGSKRWLQIVGDEMVEAKVKFDDHFFTENGERIHRIPMGNTVEEGYKNLLRAYNNQQKNSYAMTEDDKDERRSMMGRQGKKSFKKTNNKK